MPEQLDIDDTQADAFDHVYQRGLLEAQQIAVETKTFGRMKYIKARTHNTHNAQQRNNNHNDDHDNNHDNNQGEAIPNYNLPP